MAIDHFIRHKDARNRTDWNFNILFDGQPQVAAYAEQYGSLLNHKGLYEPIPGKWLHCTVLRVGFLEDFTDAEMLEAARRVETKLADMQMPEFLLGQWWIWGGNPCVHFTPEGPLVDVFDALVDELKGVLGEGRLAVPLKFTPHITLAYSRTYSDEAGLFRQLESKQVKAVVVRAKSISLIKQRVTNNYYTWEKVRDIPIGQI